MEVKTLDPKVASRIAKSFADNLRLLMESKGLSPYRLAKDSGIANQQIYRYLDPENNSDPTVSTLLKLCEALECELTDLITI